MKNRFLVLISMLLICFFVVGCSKEEQSNSDALKFKESYESMNGKENKYGTLYRKVSIDEDNPFIYITADELVKKLDNKESFYVYFGSNKCPWCRSVIEEAIKWAKEQGVSKVYYVEIWDEDGNEILRDKYSINDDGKVEKVIDGTKSYYEILKRFDNVLDDYTLEDKKGNIVDVNEKRIFAPNFVYVSEGQAMVLVTGISDKQETATSELTSEIINDEATTFNSFFATHLTCSEALC